MRKKLLILFFVVVILITLNIPIAAVDYSDARQDESLREDYLEELLETYPPPADVSVERIRYTEKDSETATMAVKYLPFMVGDDEILLQLQLVVYPQSFEQYKLEDDFLSTLFHEYNHLRAINRDKMIEEENDYMDLPNLFDSELTQGLELTSANNSSNNQQATNKPKKNLADVDYDIKWEDVYDFNNYDSEYIDKDNPDLSLLIIRRFVRNHILEMLALEEEIHLHQTKLNPSLEFSSSRFTVYNNHYSKLIKGLDSLGASEELKASLEAIFYREWVYKKVDLASSSP